VRTRKQNRLAIAGLIAALALIAVSRMIVSSSPDSKMAIVENDWKELIKAMTEWGVEHGAFTFPPDTSVRRREEPSHALTFETSTGYFRTRPVGRDGRLYEYWFSLTTPLAYVSKYPEDPFHPGRYYSYACWNAPNEVIPLAFLHSPGPNRRNDIEPGLLQSEIGKYLEARPRYAGISDKDLGVLKMMISPHLYDPTNGAKSGGDLIVIIDQGRRVFGWRNDDREEWKTAPLPNRPLYTDERDRPDVDESWKPGDAFPDPLSVTEEMALTEGIPVPFSLANTMRITGYMRYGAEAAASLDAFRDIQNCLSRDFKEFFKAPRTLTSEEVAALETAVAADRNWWPIIKGCRSASFGQGFESLPAEKVYMFLPLYGKSQILYAAYEMKSGNSGAARERIANLEKALEEMNNMSRGNAHPYAKQIYDELICLCTELARHIPDKD